MCAAHMQIRERVRAGKDEGEGEGSEEPLELGPQATALVHPLRQRAGWLGRHGHGADEACNEACIQLCQSGTSKCVYL